MPWNFKYITAFEDDLLLPSRIRNSSFGYFFVQLLDVEEQLSLPCINMPPCSIFFRCTPWTHLLGFLEAAWRGTMTEGVVISYHLLFLSPSPFLPSSRFWVTWVTTTRVGAQQSGRTSILGSESPCLVASRGHRFLQRHCHTASWVSNLGRLVAQTSKGLNLSRACRSDLNLLLLPTL